MTVSWSISKNRYILHGKHDTMWSINVKPAEGETYEKRNFELHTEQGIIVAACCRIVVFIMKSVRIHEMTASGTKSFRF